jgi:ribosomal protein S18 acetylase RimI-like enzyme
MAPVSIRLIASDVDARAAARIMASTDPWIALGRTFEQTYRAVTNPQAEGYVAVADGEVVGVVLLAVNVPLINGYIGALAVAADYRNRGVGSRLLAFGEERILRASPNVFLCVSSFNTEAQRFYARHGYAQVGLLENYVLPGKHELLMRKTTGAWSMFNAE